MELYKKFLIGSGVLLGAYLIISLIIYACNKSNEIIEENQRAAACRINVRVLNNDADFSTFDCKRCIEKFIEKQGGVTVEVLEGIQIGIENIERETDKNGNITIMWDIKLRNATIIASGEAKDMIQCQISFNNKDAKNELNLYKSRGREFASVFDVIRGEPEEQLEMLLFGIESIKNIFVLLNRNGMDCISRISY